MRDAVQKWLESGAEVQAGLRLLSLYAKNEHLAQLVTARPDRYKSLLIDTLCKTAGPYRINSALKFFVISNISTSKSWLSTSKITDNAYFP